MTDQLIKHAAQHASLLRALKAGDATSVTDLAAKADVLRNHVNRTLDLLEAEGLITRDDPDPVYAATLTAAAERALEALDFYQGAIPLGGGPQDTVEIPVALIDDWPDQPRNPLTISQASILEMAQSVADKGVFQPVLVRPHPVAEGRFQVIVGERRRLGSRMAIAEGWKPADFTLPARIRDLSDDEAFEIAVAENTQREDLHWMDEARGFLRMHERGRSPAEIERISGTKRKLRSVQDLIKIARELPPELVAKTYLPERLDDGSVNKDRLTYVAARDLVGDKKEKPALDLNPRQRMTLLEILYVAYQQAGSLATTEPAIARLTKAPTGGPIHQLEAMKLVEYGLQGPTVLAKVKLTPEVVKFLEQSGFWPDGASRDACLYRAQCAVIGDLQAHNLQPGQFVTPELNAPEPADGPQDGARAPSPPPIPPTGEGAQTPAPPVDSDDEPAPLPPMLEIILVEIAHKLGKSGVQSPAGGWGVPVLADWYKDARINQLIQGRKLLRVDPMGEKTLAVQTERAREFLTHLYKLEPGHDGVVTASDDLLVEAQLGLMGAKPATLYCTPWLNTAAAKAETVEQVAIEPDPAVSEPDPLTPAQRRILRELAARSLHRHRLWDGWVLAHAAALTDPDFRAIWDLELVTHRRGDADDVEIALTLRGRDHLKTRGQAPQEGLSRNSCATSWLRETLPAAPPSVGEAAEPGNNAEILGAVGTSEFPPRHDQFAADMIRVAAESRALARCVAALKEAKVTIGAASARKLKLGEIDQMASLIDGAIEAAGPYLPEAI